MLFVYIMLLFFFFLPLIFANAFSHHALSWFIDTLFVYFKYDFPSCAVLLICLFFLILCSHHFLYERAMCSLQKLHLKITIIIIIITSQATTISAIDN